MCPHAVRAELAENSLLAPCLLPAVSVVPLECPVSIERVVRGVCVVHRNGRWGVPLHVIGDLVEGER